MNSISFNPQGRFGNNIFQYITTKIFQKLYNEIHKTKLEYKYNTKQNAFILYENSFFQIYQALNHKMQLALNRNVYLDGFYQFDYHIQDNLEYIKSIFTNTNDEIINEKYKVSDLVKSFEQYKNDEFTDQDLVLHLRLDDFVNEGYNSFLIHPMSYVDIINKIQEEQKFKNVYIVCDIWRRKWEQEYVQTILDNVKEKNIILLPPKDLLTDMARIYYAKNVLCSNSTFCWIPAFLGRCEKNWMPNKNTCSNQRFYKINQYTELYNVEYLTMTKQESIEQLVNMITK
jgi:hypothetical protein